MTKKLLLVIFILGSFSASLKSQSSSLMSVVDIYDFNIGDVFETKVGGYSSPPTYTIDTIINKYFSLSMDTVFYVKNSRAYTSPACPPPCTGSASYNVGTIVFYTNLNDTIGKGLGSKPIDINCIDTNGYTGVWVDTTYYNPNYCNTKTTSISYLNNGPQLTDTCYTYFEPYSGEDIYGKGLGRIYHYYNTCSNGFPNCEEGSQLIYFKKDTLTCGNYSGVYIAGINQLTQNINQISIYPNPFKDFFNIIAKSNIHEIELLDLQGRILLNQKINQPQFKIDLSNYPNGFYLLKVTTEKGESIQQLIKH